MPIGLGTYAVNLLQALDRREDEHEYFVYTPTWNEVPPLGPRFRVRRSRALRGSRAALTLWDQTLPPVAAARDRSICSTTCIPPAPRSRPAARWS